MTIKYFYIEDDTGVLFAANGTALTALMVGVTEIVPLIKFQFPTLPMWFYFVGLICAFVSKAMIQMTNSDTLQREKLQSARDTLMEAESKQNLPPEMKNELAKAWNQMAIQHSKLWKLEWFPRINLVRAIFFVFSALCFLIATAQLIYFAGFLGVK